MIVGNLIDCRVRRYLDVREELRARDALLLFEVAIAWAVSEAYVALVLPALGLVSNEPCPWATHVPRGLVFFGGPLSYMLMYGVVCGGIHHVYTRWWPEEGRRLSIQGKPMSDAQLRKAVLFSLKSICAASGVSSFFHYAMQGWTNVRWGLPQLGELPWLVFGYFLVDINAYVVHRGLHRPWWYAHVHKVHHMWKSPNVFVTSALHPLELLAQAVPTCAILVSLPISFPTLVVSILGIYVCNAIDHSGMRLEGLLLCRLMFWHAKPEFHDQHHQYFHVNYGQMVDWWDRLGGTYYHPKEDGPIGVGEGEFATADQLRLRAGASLDKAKGG